MSLHFLGLFSIRLMNYHEKLFWITFEIKMVVPCLQVWQAIERVLQEDSKAEEQTREEEEEDSSITFTQLAPLQTELVTQSFNPHQVRTSDFYYFFFCCLCLCLYFFRCINIPMRHSPSFYPFCPCHFFRLYFFYVLIIPVYSHFFAHIVFNRLHLITYHVTRMDRL